MDREWISIMERLPDRAVPVLLTDGEEVTVAEFGDDDGWSVWCVSEGWRMPKAWMPLPAPPVR